MDQGASAEMPKYKCYKEVHALKINNFQVNGETVKLFFEDTRFAPIEVTTDWANKHDLAAGGYYVVYKDGYKSFSPAVAFEEGYELIK